MGTNVIGNHNLLNSDRRILPLKLKSAVFKSIKTLKIVKICQ